MWLPGLVGVLVLFVYLWTNAVLPSQLQPVFTVLFIILAGNIKHRTTLCKSLKINGFKLTQYWACVQNCILPYYAYFIFCSVYSIWMVCTVVLWVHTWCNAKDCCQRLICGVLQSQFGTGQENWDLCNPITYNRLQSTQLYLSSVRMNSNHHFYHVPVYQITKK